MTGSPNKILSHGGLAKFRDKERRDIQEVLEDRNGISSTIIASQIPTDKWHDAIGESPDFVSQWLRECLELLQHR